MRRLCFYMCLWFYPSMHCRWYPSIPCSRSLGGCLLQDHSVFREGLSTPTESRMILEQDRITNTCKNITFVSPPPLKAEWSWKAEWSRSRHPPGGATVADGTHPTGKHSCHSFIYTIDYFCPDCYLNRDLWIFSLTLYHCATGVYYYYQYNSIRQNHRNSWDKGVYFAYNKTNTYGRQ